MTTIFLLAFNNCATSLLQSVAGSTSGHLVSSMETHWRCAPWPAGLLTSTLIHVSPFSPLPPTISFPPFFFLFPSHSFLLLSSSSLPPPLLHPQLTYLCEAEIDDIRVVVNWFRFLKLFLKDHHPSIWSELSTECNLVMGMGINEDLMANLALEKFRPWGSPMKEANKHFFLQLKGLAMLVCVYEVMLMESWKTMLLRLKMVEGGMLLAIANFASTDEFQEEVLSLDAVGLCTQSFVRVLLRRGQAVVDTSGSPGRQEHNDLILKEVIESALEVLYRSVCLSGMATVQYHTHKM